MAGLYWWLKPLYSANGPFCTESLPYPIMSAFLSFSATTRCSTCVEQCDGLTLPEIEQPRTSPEIDEDELCESIVTGWENRPALYLNSRTEYRAYYRPSTDSVHMPARSRFLDAPHYYSTLFHELVHSKRGISRRDGRGLPLCYRGNCQRTH